MVELIAAHYIEALRAVPDAPDAAQTRARAREMLLRAGDRAAGLAAPVESLRYFTQALELTDDALGRARLEERAGEAAATAGRAVEARAHLDRAFAAYRGGGPGPRRRPGLRRAGRGRLLRGQPAAAIDRMQGALEVLSTEQPDADIAEVSAQLGRLMFFVGRGEEGSHT